MNMPESLKFFPMYSLNDEVSFVSGLSPTGALIHFVRMVHEDDDEPGESRLLEITGWEPGAEGFKTLWTKFFYNDPTEDYIYWNSDTNELIPDEELPGLEDITTPMMYGPPSVMRARKQWDEIMADPYTFLLRVMTLEVL